MHLYRRDGHAILANVRSLVISSADQLECLVVLIQDLSQEEQYRLENQQLEQRAVIGEVSAIFAHEVRNPINNISTGLQLLAMTLPADDPKQETISRLQNDCERLADLMKSTLSFVRPVEYRMEMVDLGASLKRLLERWHPHMARVNIQHFLTVDPETPQVEGDVRALEQIWNNLISNAIQAMGKDGGTLAIRVRPLKGPSGSQKVEVSLSDTGMGIPDDVRERIFEPFFTTNRNGTGLGLSITKQIVTTHKGTINVNSVPGGTVFQVQLPVPQKRSNPGWNG
jgi:signal transduction histidine kinase